MATGTIISVIGTGVTLLSFLLDSVPDAPDGAKISYIIANDGANGDLSGAGGDMPDMRLWDETGEFLGINADPGGCGEGATNCETEVDTQEAPTYALFTGNDDAICIAWTGMNWSGQQKKFGFHPGNWAHACDYTSYNSGSWYYAGTVVPGIQYDDDVFCAWVDRNGDTETAAFQVHWPEFDGDNSPEQSLDYYCRERPPVEFYTDSEHSSVWTWSQVRALQSENPAAVVSEGMSYSERKRTGHERLSKRFEKDPRIIKSRSNKHQATELCNPELHAAGQSFVSYAEEKFCYMPTKTTYDFCANVEDGACWDDEENKVVVKGNTNGRVAVPDLSHIDQIIEW